MNLLQLCNAILANYEWLRDQINEWLDQKFLLNTRITLRTGCLEEFDNGVTHLSRRSCLADIRRRASADPKFYEVLLYRMGRDRVNLDRFLSGKQGQNDLRKWIGLADFCGRDITLAPRDWRVLLGFGYATITASQHLCAVQHGVPHPARRAAWHPVLCLDGNPIVEGSFVNVVTIQQTSVLLPLCEDRRLQKDFATSVVCHDGEGQQRSVWKALDRWRPQWAEDQQVRRGFDVLARDAERRAQFIKVTCDSFFWPAMIAYQAIEPVTRYLRENRESEPQRRSR